MAPRNKKIKKRSMVLSTIGIFFKSIFLFILLTGIAISGYVIYKSAQYVNGEPFALDKYKADQVQTSIIYRRETEEAEFTEYTRLHGETNRIWVSLEDIPRDMKNAIIALEDKRFNDHNGVDWIRTIGVMVKPSNSGQGGSTITQQLVKNLTDEKDVTFVRKFKEILTALNLEKNYSKDEILETYLNTLYLGEGCYGIKTAAEVYFGKEIEDLNLAECATLACITKAPGMYDPLINPENNAERRKFCLDSMLAEGYINRREYKEALNCDLVFSNDPNFVSQIEESTEIESPETIQSYYVDHIINQLIEDFQTDYDLSYIQAWKKVYYGGLRIYSAENTEIQDLLENVYETREGFPDIYGSNGERVQSAMTIMDYQGRIVALVGGADEKTEDRSLNRATQSPRQPGSSIKPLSVYTYAIDSNQITWGTRILDYSGTKRDGKLWPTNYGGSTGSGAYVTTQYALKKSLNTVPYRILEYVGLDNAYDFMKNKLYFTTMVDGIDDADYSPLCVGGMNRGLTSLEMTAAFAVYGSGGKYYKPYPYFKVTNSDGSIVYFDNTKPEGEQVISADTAEVMNRMLQTVITEGTGSGYGVGDFQTFAKTGTTTNNYDRWFVAGTPYYVSAVWYGYDKNKSISSSASNPAAQIFEYVYTKIHEDLPEKEFDYPGSRAKEVKYCTYSGQLAGPSCYSTSKAYFTSQYDIVCNGKHYGNNGVIGGEGGWSGTGGGSSSTEEGTTTPSENGDNPNVDPNNPDAPVVPEVPPTTFPIIGGMDENSGDTGSVSGGE
ncbi:MAG: transglycosylase [Ruminococcaceae bacterium]|nr:transglycosylase [Oscillospiraceae bacterium]